MLKILSTLKKSVQILNSKNFKPILLVNSKPACKYLPEKRFCTNVTKSEEVLSISEDDLETISEGNNEKKHKLKVLVLEAEVLRQEGKQVPSASFMKNIYWKELLSRDSRMGRKKYLEFLFKIEKKKENEVLKKQQKKLEFLQRPAPEETEHLRYDLGHNSIFLRFYDTTINNFYNWRLIQAMQFGQKLVVDCGYDLDMTSRENINCAKQLMLLFSDNRMHDDPFDIHFCNMNTNSKLHEYLHKHIPTMYNPAFPMNIHHSSYLNLFPSDKLVYLTPHCRNELEEYDHDAIYIIGAIVDKANNEPLSLAKAKREKIKMAKLPLDKHLLWGAGSGKSLTVNQTVSIMLDMKQANDWKHAFRHVPRRKLMDENEIEAFKERLRNFHDKRSRKNVARTIWKPKNSSENDRNLKKSSFNLRDILHD